MTNILLSYSQLSYGLPLPNGFSMEGFHKLEQVMAIVYSILTYNEKLRRMKAGPIVERFLKVLNDDNSEKKIYLYGGHDLNVAAYINAHNITGAPSIMDYGSTVILERLRGPDGQKYVRVSIKQKKFFFLLNIHCRSMNSLIFYSISCYCGLVFLKNYYF